MTCRLAAAVLLSTFAIACGKPSQTGADSSPPQSATPASSATATAPPKRLDVWGRTPAANPGPCTKDCVMLKTLPIAHAGGERIQVYVDRRIDDPISRWGDCLGEVIRCSFGDRAPAECVAQSKCPAPCKDAYKQRIGSEADRARQLDAFEAVFVREDAVCAPALAREKAQ